MIKIIFFDIDGTLVDYGVPQISKPVVEALLKIQQKGIKLFLATGRPNIFIPTFKSIAFDGALAFNGSYCYNNEQVIYKIPLPKDEVVQVVKNATKLNKAVAIANTKAVASNFYQPDLFKYIAIASQKLSVAENFTAFFNEDIYECMVATQASQDRELLKNASHLKTVRWVNWATDIIHKNGGKNKAIEQVLKFYGFDQTESMAFGDGQNDADMLQYAHIGIAMANATDATKQAADYTTQDVQNDGIVHALKHFHMI